jgi:hypothetical protein
MRSRRIVLTAALAVLAAAALWPGPAFARPAPGAAAGPVAPGPPGRADAVPGGFASWAELLAVQERMVRAADAVTAAARAGDGLAGISAKPERRELWVYWKGAVPTAVGRVIAAHRAEVPVRVLPARYSRAELLAAAAKVAAQPGVAAVGPLVDGSGLSVSYSTVQARQSRALRDLGVPVTERARRPALASRQNSAAPHYGGAKYTYPVDGGNAMCTTGFAIQFPRGAVKRMLTAGHCGANGDTVYSGTGSVMGTVTGDNNTRDVMLISGSVAGRTYLNGWNSSTSKPVLAAIGSYADTLVCPSGAMTGEHCRVRITATDLTINVGYLIHPVVEAVHDDGTVAAGLGDSGGPVVAQDSSGPLGGGDVVNVYAVGTITAIDLADEVPCGSSYVPTECSSTMYYVDILESLDYYNAAIVKG